jgi:flagellar hook-length control protein FliK
MTAAIPSFVQPTPQAVPQAAPRAAASAPQAPKQDFAQTLNQTRQQQAPDAAGDEPAVQDGRPAQRAQGAERGKGPEKARADKAPKAESRVARPAEKTEGQAEEAKAADEAEGPVTDAALVDFLAGLHLPPATPDSVAAEGTATKGNASDAVTPAAGKQPLATDKATPDAVRADDKSAGRELLGREFPGRADLQAGRENSAQAAAAATEALPELKPVKDVQATAAPAGLQAPVAQRSTEAAAPVAVTVPTPATAPEFAHTLGVQVSLLARDGVQEAELHLNPAEMGPISVQIAIDGTQAQVNFGADSAATREIIENGLPELAASLREAGFTLSGGGVQGQARGRGDGENRDDRRGEASRGQAANGVEADAPVRRSVARVSAGGVDLYA